MTGSDPASPGGIFISYRREEADWPATFLFDRLAGHFGSERVFQDVDSIEIGDDFVDVINQAVGSSAVLLAVIGPRWLAVTDEEGRRRLDNPEDLVRLEIEAALARSDVKVIPLLIGGARMPRSDQLPDSLQRLARRQAMELIPSRFRPDCDRLIQVLDKTLGQAPAAPASAGITAASRPSRYIRASGNESPTQAAPSRPGASAPLGPDPEVAAFSRPMGSLHGSEPGAGTRQIAFSPDGELLAAADGDETVRVWKVSERRIARSLPGPGRVAYSVAFSPDGNLLAVAGDDTRVWLWPTATWNKRKTKALVCHNVTVRAVAFSPAGTLLASAGENGTVVLWGTATGAKKSSLLSATSGERIYNIAFSPDGSTLASAGARGVLELFDVTGESRPRRIPTGGDGGILSVAFSPDGSLLAFCPRNSGVILWDLNSGRQLHRIQHVGGMYAVAFSPDGTLVAAGGVGRRIWLWDVATGKTVVTLPECNSRITSIAFSAAGQWLAAAGIDGEIQLWG